MQNIIWTYILEFVRDLGKHTKKENSFQAVPLMYMNDSVKTFAFLCHLIFPKICRILKSKDRLIRKKQSEGLGKAAAQRVLHPSTLGGRGRLPCVNSWPDWFTKLVPGQPELHNEI